MPDGAILLGHVLRGGELIADRLWKPGTTSIQAAPKYLSHHFGLDFGQFIGLANQVREEVQLEAEVYGMALGNAVDCESLVETARRHSFELAVEFPMDLDSLSAAFHESSLP